jgi:cell division protease FtsH
MITMRASRGSAVHRTGPANSGPPPDRPIASAPPSPPMWRNWLLVAGLVLTVPLFLLPVGPKVQEIGYSQLKSDIAAGQVASLALGPDGSISGKPAWVESAVPGGTHPATSAPAP